MEIPLDSFFGEIRGNLFSEHYIKNKVERSIQFKSISKEAKQKYNEIKGIYSKTKDLVDSLDEASFEKQF